MRQTSILRPAGAHATTDSRRRDPIDARDAGVLVVDDDPNVLRSVSRMLCRTCRVTTADSASQAAILLDAFPYQTVISDLCMPGHDGLWLLERVRRRHPEVRRVLLTSEDGEKLSAHVGSGLVQELLSKPASPDEIRAALRS
jgi:DNA-binding NtrC family response regulator